MKTPKRKARSDNFHSNYDCLTISEVVKAAVSWFLSMRLISAHPIHAINQLQRENYSIE